MEKYYVYFFKNGRKECHCFENDKNQAEHFANLVNGKVVKENES